MLMQVTPVRVLVSVVPGESPAFDYRHYPTALREVPDDGWAAPVLEVMDEIPVHTAIVSVDGQTRIWTRAEVATYLPGQAVPPCAPSK